MLGFQGFTGFRKWTIAAGLMATCVLGGCGSMQQPGTGTGVLSPSDKSVSFGDVKVGSATSQMISLTNTGSENVKISSVSVSGQGYSVSGGAKTTLMPNQAVPIYVNFGPSALGFAGGTLSVKSNASNPLVQVNVSGTGITAQVSGHDVTLSWTPASGVVGYFVYRGTVSGGPYTKLNAVPDTQPSFMDSGLQSGSYFYVVTSVTAGGVESGFSSELEVTVP